MTSRNGRAAPLPPDERRSAIIEATVPLVREHGFAVSTRQIAEAAGVAEGTLFRVFSNKRALIDAAVESALDPQRGVRMLEAIDPTTPLTDRVARVVEILRYGMESTWRLHVALRGSERERPSRPRSSEQGFQAREILNQAVSAVLEPDADRLVVPPAQAARVISLMSIVAAFPPFGPAQGSEPPLTTEQVVDILLYGLVNRSEL